MRHTLKLSRVGLRKHSGSILAPMALLLVAATSCTTGTSQIETPTGPTEGVNRGPYVILGVEGKVTSLHADNARYRVDEIVPLKVPVGTEIIVPALTGWTIGYGSTQPPDLSAPGTTFNWQTEDHNYGWGLVNVVAEDIDAPAPGATYQTAKVHVAVLLSDENADDSFWGVVRYQLMYLGRPFGVGSR